MTWKAIWTLITNWPRIASAFRAVVDWVKEFMTNRKVENAKKAVDHTVATGDQRKEEAAIGLDSGVPHVDPNGGLMERPVKDRSKW